MALICYDNALDRASSVTSDLANQDQLDTLLAPQLQPKAVKQGGSMEITAFWDSRAEELDCVAMLGIPKLVVGLVEGTIKIEKTDDTVTSSPISWTELELNNIERIIRIRNTQFDEEHVVVVFAARFEFRGLRVTTRTAQLGHLFAGRVIEHSQLASSFSFVPRDTTQIESSTGGQNYTSVGTVRRQIEVEQAAFKSNAMLFGGLISPVEFTLPAATLSGSVALDGTDSDGNTRYLASGSGTVTWSGALTSGKFYRVSYRMEDKTTLTALGGSNWQTLDAPDVDPAKRNQAQYGETTIEGEATSTDLVFTFFSADGARLTIINVEEDSEPDTLKTRRFLNGGLLKVYETSGKNKPIILVVKPDDPVWSSRTGYFGLIESWNRQRHIENQIYGAGFTMIESL